MRTRRAIRPNTRSSQYSCTTDLQKRFIRFPVATKTNSVNASVRICSIPPHLFRYWLRGAADTNATRVRKECFQSGCRNAPRISFPTKSRLDFRRKFSLIGVHSRFFSSPSERFYPLQQSRPFAVLRPMSIVEQQSLLSSRCFHASIYTPFRRLMIDDHRSRLKILYKYIVYIL